MLYWLRRLGAISSFAHIKFLFERDLPVLSRLCLDPKTTLYIIVVILTNWSCLSQFLELHSYRTMNRLNIGIPLGPDVPHTDMASVYMFLISAFPRVFPKEIYPCASTLC
jgi:di/tricarboxylate transporter